MIDKMGNYPIFDSPTTVYKLNGFSLQELLSQFWKHINEVIEGTNLTREDMDNLIKETDERLNAQDKILSEFIEWVKNEALPPLVEEEILKMYEDGRLKELINDKIFNDLSMKVEQNKIDIIELRNFLNYMPINGGDFIDGNPPTNPIVNGGVFNYQSIISTKLRRL